ncbi:MAG: hypothetical protein NT001_07280 [Candidatus Woesearchaeota archaeon]|nr:hypothetical protein [Candidatus Woesearchaeota archaeon]
MKKEKTVKVSFSRQLSRSFYAMKGSGLSIVIPVLFDLIFIFLYGSIMGYFSSYIISNLYSFGSAILQSNDITGTPMMGNVMGALLLMFLLLFIVYALFEGASWRMSRIFATKEKISYAGYLKGFTLANLVWFIPYLIYKALSFLVAFKFKYGDASQTAQAGIMQNIPLLISTALVSLFLLILAYFSSVSYPLIGKSRTMKAIKDSFVIGYRNFMYIAPRMIFAIALFLIANMAVVLTSRISMALMIVLGVLILLPMMTWARIYLHMIMQDLE